MSVKGFLNRVTKRDTAVYWGNPTNDGYGDFTYDAPVDIPCFWMDITKTIANNEGREVVSNARVFVLQDLDQHGRLYHGKLEDLTTAQKDDPKGELPNSYEIMVFDKIPGLRKSDEYERIAYL